MAVFGPNFVRLIFTVTCALSWVIVNGNDNVLDIGRLSVRNPSSPNNATNNEIGSVQHHRLKPAIISSPPTCFNATVIQKTVFKSSTVFAGKIIKMTEQQVTLEPPTTTTAAPPEDSSAYYFYSKKRRKVDTTPAKTRPKSTVYVAMVTVKTVFKGMQADLEGKTIQIGINPPGKLSSDSVLTQPRCLRRLRSLDTRIFFYTENGVAKETALKKRARAGEEEDFRGKWTQVLIPLPPTLRILDVVRSAVKGKQQQLNCQFYVEKQSFFRFRAKFQL